LQWKRGLGTRAEIYRGGKIDQYRFNFAFDQGSGAKRFCQISCPIFTANNPNITDFLSQSEMERNVNMRIEMVENDNIWPEGTDLSGYQMLEEMEERLKMVE
jgi:hypothetical protein